MTSLLYLDARRHTKLQRLSRAPVHYYISGIDEVTLLHCRAVARVRVKSVKNMLPYIVANVLHLHDTSPAT
jgi:hypothetical protein